MRSGWRLVSILQIDTILLVSCFRWFLIEKKRKIYQSQLFFRIFVSFFSFLFFCFFSFVSLFFCYFFRSFLHPEIFSHYFFLFSVFVYSLDNNLFAFFILYYSSTVSLCFLLSPLHCPHLPARNLPPYPLFFYKTVLLFVSIQHCSLFYM